MFYELHPTGTPPEPKLDDQGRPTTLFGFPVVYTEAVKPGEAMFGRFRLADCIASHTRRDKGI